MENFKKKVVWITGASSGIGASLARELAKKGAFVALTARRTDRLQILAKELEKLGGEVLISSCDVTKDEDPPRVLDEIIQKWGNLDIVIANAGFGVMGAFEKIGMEDYRRQFETNVFGVLRTFYAGLESLKKTKGKMVVIGSVMGHVSLPESSAYAMSKFAIRAFVESIVHEMKSYGIDVILISPGLIRTEFQKIDNHGELHPDHSPKVPDFLYLSAEKAAIQILSAIVRSKKEQVITLHGKILVLMKRLFPALFQRVIGLLKITGRGAPAFEKSGFLKK